MPIDLAAFRKLEPLMASWPAATRSDVAAWLLGTNPDGAIADINESSAKTYLDSYTAVLVRARAMGFPVDNLSPTELWTEDRVIEFVRSELAAGAAPASVRIRLVATDRICLATDSTADRRHLRRALHRIPRPAPAPKNDDANSSKLLADLIARMDAILAGTSDADSALEYRGLVSVSLWLTRPRRRGTFVKLRLTQPDRGRWTATLAESQTGYNVIVKKRQRLTKRFGRNTNQQNTAFGGKYEPEITPVPDVLVPYLRAWITRFRPLLSRPDDDGWCWLTNKGRHLSSMQLYKVCKAIAGLAPKDLRPRRSIDAIVADPNNASDIHRLLSNTPEVASRHYAVLDRTAALKIGALIVEILD